MFNENLIRLSSEEIIELINAIIIIGTYLPEIKDCEKPLEEYTILLSLCRKLLMVNLIPFQPSISN